MPTYEYECLACGHIFDVFHAMTAKPRVKCEKCGGRTKKRIGAGAGIIFKGSGFYETDYKKKAGAPASEAKKSERADAASKPAEGKKEEKKSTDSKND